MRAIYQICFGLTIAVSTFSAFGFPFDKLTIGARFDDVRNQIGQDNFAVGGPSSKKAQHVELSGPIATEISGSSNQPLYAVFESHGVRKGWALSHLHWNMSAEHEHKLLQEISAFILRSAEYGTARCYEVKNVGLLAVRDSPSSWSREAVLEPLKHDKNREEIKMSEVRPSYAEICPNGPN